MPDPTSEGRALEAARLARREAALAARPSMASTEPAPDRLRVATWNLNSLKARSAAVERFLTRVRPDVLCLQETKTARLSEAVPAMFGRAGYTVAHIGTGADNGVAIAARSPIDAVSSSGEFGDERLDREPRLTTCVVHLPQRLRVASHDRGPVGTALRPWPSRGRRRTGAVQAEAHEATGSPSTADGGH